jgi:large subunit ribosomal protein L17
MLSNMCSSLIEHGRIKTTLAKAKALRPFAEKIVTLAKKAEASETGEQKLHYRRQAIARIRNKEAVKKLFDERVTEFTNRQGGYTRIYKIGQRRGDAAEVAIIELIDAADEGYSKKKKKPASKKEAVEVTETEEKVEVEATETAEAPEASTEEAPAKEDKEENK